MLKRRKNKVRWGAWVPRELANAVDDWIAQYPGRCRSDFLLEAACERLKAAGIRGLSGYSRSKSRSSAKASKRAGKVLFASWVDERIAAAADIWLENNPNASRTELLIESIAAKLRNSGVKLPIDISKPALPGRRVRKEAYAGIHLDSEGARREIEKCIENFTKRACEFLKSGKALHSSDSLVLENLRLLPDQKAVEEMLNALVAERAAAEARIQKCDVFLAEYEDIRRRGRSAGLNIDAPETNGAGGERKRT